MLRIIRYIIVVILSFLFHLYFYHSDSIKNFDHDFYDLTTRLLTTVTKESDSYSVIIDIDEKSLQRVGQWPWPRIVNAQLIDKINSMNPSSIGIDILFPERDRVSPLAIKNFYKSFFDLKIEFDSFTEEFKDNDKILAKSIKNSNATLSTYFNNSPHTTPHCENLSYRDNFFSKIKTEFNSPSLLCNYHVLQDGVENFGFINAWADSDGIFRRIPIFISYDNKVFPSFALATILSVYKNITIDSDPTRLIDFSISKPKIISAIDILYNKVSPIELQGKIVLLGSSIVGLDSTYLIPNGEKISNSMLHASVIENILSDSFYTQPQYYKQINITLSFLLSLLVIFMLSKKCYIQIFILFFVIGIVSYLWLMDSYLDKVYISIGYLWTPSLYFFFIVTLFFIVLGERDKRLFYKELLESHSATVESISLVVSMRDDETGEHIQRTKYYVQELAQYLYKKKMYPETLNPNYIYHLTQAAPLHDIGKVGIPDKVLKKNGRYTKEEYEVMKEHPLIAKRVIEKVMSHYSKNIFLKVAYNIAYYHHERWDGKGYPVGLKEDEIPLEAQLMAIADVYDALISKRCYKDKYSFEMSESIIIKERGKTFNPIIVDAFLEIKDSFREIAIRYRDA
jgi:adenylate cyclase